MEVTSFAPGRVELLGNHTDYNEGVVLSAATHLGVHSRASDRPDGRMVFSSEGFEGARGVDRIEKTGLWLDYPLGVAAMLADSGHRLGGFEIHFSSDLPRGAGLSSSAAMEVSTALALMGLFGIGLEPLALAKLCRRAENEFVGVNCGLLDQASSIFGKSNHAIYLDFRSEQVSNIPFPDGVELLITNSGVAHALTGGEYNERRSQCMEAAERLGVRALRDVTGEQLAAADLPPLVKRRATHIVGENERVLSAVECLARGDVAEFGRLMTQSHRSSIENFENSTPELDALVEIATGLPGVLGSRLTGGGFGGATVTLVYSSEADQVAEKLLSLYRERTGHVTTSVRCRIADGAHRVG